MASMTHEGCRMRIVEIRMLEEVAGWLNLVSLLQDLRRIPGVRVDLSDGVHRGLILLAEDTVGAGETDAAIARRLVTEWRLAGAKR